MVGTTAKQILVRMMKSRFFLVQRSIDFPLSSAGGGGGGDGGGGGGGGGGVFLHLKIGTFERLVVVGCGRKSGQVLKEIREPPSMGGG